MNRMRSPRRLYGELCKAVEYVLREPSAGIEQDLQATEKGLAQRAVGAQRGQQHFEALRHIEIDSRRDLAQVSYRGLDRAGQRLAFVDIERAAIVEHETEIVIAAEGMIPRQPIDQDRRLLADERHRGADHRLIGGEHAVRVLDTLRPPGRARSEENLGHVVRLDARMRGFDCACGWHLQKPANEVVDRPAGGFAVTATSTSRGSAAVMARAKAAPLLAKTRPGERISMMVLSLPKSCDNSE